MLGPSHYPGVPRFYRFYCSIFSIELMESGPIFRYRTSHMSKFEYKKNLRKMWMAVLWAVCYNFQQLDYINSRHSNVYFTIEHEVEWKLSFFDCCVQRSRNKFISSVFRKPTFSGLGISFLPFYSFRFKINSMKTLLFCSYISLRHLVHAELNFLREFFVNNGFPIF